MSISVELASGAGRARVTIDRFPDVCPQCHLAGKQTRYPGPPVEARGKSIEPSLWIPLICPIDQCARPYYAVYERPSPLSAYAPDYEYRYSTPFKPQQQHRDEVLERISTKFYSILDQALAAEQYNLNLIAGMGYRKALEYLVKDFVTMDLRVRHREAQSRNDEASVSSLTEATQKILRQDLKTIIQMIPHALTAQAAERCAWLGNDETHYTRIWTKHDIDDLKTLLGIVMTFMSNEEKAKAYVEKMQRPSQK